MNPCKDLLSVSSTYIVPSAPQDVTVLSQGFTSLTLTWTTPQSPNGVILSYTVRMLNHNILYSTKENIVFLKSKTLMNQIGLASIEYFEWKLEYVVE